jgi:type IV secretory pathway VirJ component
MKKLIVILLLISSKLMGQNALPVTEYKGTNAVLPLICYLTGDGGINAFSKSLIQSWNSRGYSVVVLNSKSYFWKKQTPEQATTDVNNLLLKYMAAWKCTTAILMGYSFGADVLPFIQNRLPATTSNKLTKLVMISPSNTTDFEVHLFYGKSGSSVPAEINKLTKPGLVIFGKDEKDTPTTISNPKVAVLSLPGDHHYNDDANAMVQQVISRL